MSVHVRELIYYSMVRFSSFCSSWRKIFIGVSAIGRGPALRRWLWRRPFTDPLFYGAISLFRGFGILIWKRVSLTVLYTINRLLNCKVITVTKAWRCDRIV